MTIARMTVFLPPSLAPEHVGGERVDAVEEQQAVEVVELVLQAARLEALRADDAVGRARLHHDLGGAADVGGQLGDAEAALAPDLGAGRPRRSRGLTSTSRPFAPSPSCAP